MSNSYATLVRDAILYLKSCSGTSICTKEEWETFMDKKLIRSPQIKESLQRIAPGLTLSDQIPDDAAAKRAKVIILACDDDPATLDLLKKLARSIDQKLGGPVKILSAKRLDDVKKSGCKLLIASAGFNAEKSEIPLIVLAPPRFYDEAPHEKGMLWKRICASLS
jgi:hypothetical protein